MIDPLSLASTGLAFFLVAVSPGPATLSNSTIAMSHGRKTSLIYGAGLSTGLVFWGVIAASGMGALLQSSLYVLELSAFPKTDTKCRRGALHCGRARINSLCLQ